MAKLYLSIIVAIMLITLAILVAKKSDNTSTLSKLNSMDSKLTTQQKVSHLYVVEFGKKISEQNVIVVDVRTPEEFNSGHIVQSINLDFNDPDFETNLGKLDKTKSYGIYCRTGVRSGKALDAMKRSGFTDVVDLQGGIMAWVDSKMAVECSTGSVCLNQ